MEHLYKLTVQGIAISENNRKQLEAYVARSKDKQDTNTLNYLPFIWEE